LTFFVSPVQRVWYKGDGGAADESRTATAAEEEGREEHVISLADGSRERQNFKATLRGSDICPNCSVPKPFSRRIFKRGIPFINEVRRKVEKEGLVHHDCWDCAEYWYTRATPEQRERILEELAKY
jgi:hypothetical protein